MQYKDIQEALRALAETSAQLEEQYIENGGEITEETEGLEAAKDALAKMLKEDGIDTLGRWLKAKEDEKATYKAEKAAADARIKSVDNTIEFVKEKVGEILRATGVEKAKGAFYSFSQRTSTKTSFNAEALDDAFLDLVTEAARAAGLPGYVDVALKTTATRIRDWGEEHEGEGLEFYEVETSPSISFTKPRAPKEQ